MGDRFITLDSENWANEIAFMVKADVEEVVCKFGLCNVMLTGGRSAEKVYTALHSLPKFQELTNVNFYFGDERCIDPCHQESNYALAMRSLFRDGIPKGCSVARIKTENADVEAAAFDYENLLPERIDILLLSIGEDGHIASIFPQDNTVLETNRLVIPVVAPKYPCSRITITPNVLYRATKIFVMAIGAKKEAVFNKVASVRTITTREVMKLPALLVRNAVWLFNSQIDG